MTFDKDQVWRKLSSTPGNYYAEASEQEQTEFRAWLHDMLAQNKVTVTFTKADGAVRVMECTLSTDHGAVFTVNENAKPKAPNLNACAVWDCNQQAWRSFRYDRLNDIAFTIS